MSDISYINDTFLKEFRSSIINEPFLYVSVLDKPLVMQRKNSLEDYLINENFDYINVIDTDNHQNIIKNKFVTNDSILILMRIKNRYKKESINYIDSIILKSLNKILSVDMDKLSVNDSGEIYLYNKKILSFDIKEINKNKENCIYIFMALYCKNTHKYYDLLENISVKSKYGYIDDYYLIKNINHLCQYIKSLLINEFYIKDFSKSYTLKYIKNLLKNLKISSIDETTKIVNNIYVSKIDLPSLGMQQLGKGLTREASLCSGYAEVIERLQNLQFFPNSLDIISNINNYDFKIYPDEKVVNDKVYIPFYNLGSNSIEYLDIMGVWDSQKSNGMSSGNTYHEAIVQSICEIFERYVENIIYDNNLTPPDIDISYIRDNYYFQYTIIKELEDKLNVKIIVKDCSINNTFPVLALIIIDNKDKTYKKVFGSHPLFEEALNRCLSELLQKNYIDFNDIKLKNFTNIYLSNYYDKSYFKLMRSNGHLGKISIPISFLRKEPSWSFIPWKEDNIYSNLLWTKGLLDILKLYNKNFYIRSTDFIGFPSIYIYIPNLSEIPVNEYSYYQKQIDLLVHEQKALKTKDVQNVLDLVENYEDNTCLCKTDRDLLLIYLYFISSNYEKIISLIRNKIDSDDNLKCLSMEIYLKLNNILEEDRDHILNIFFNTENINYIKRFWRNEKDSISIFRDDICDNIIDINQFIALKELISKNTKNQYMFNKLLEEG